MNTSFAQSAPVSLQAGDDGYDVLLDAATGPLRDKAGGDVRVEVERLDTLGRWAFLQGAMHDREGGRARWTGTEYAERAAQGGMSNVYVALLHRDSEDAPWVVLDHAIGPGDVAWLTWPDEHAAPRALFGF